MPLPARRLIGQVRPPLSADAALTTCRTDPSVTLSDGTTVGMSAAIYSDGAADIQHIIYALHIPTGLTVTQVACTKDPLAGNRESFQFVADQEPGTYASTTVVTTKNKDIQVSATTAVTSATSKSATASGYAGQSLSVQLVL